MHEPDVPSGETPRDAEKASNLRPSEDLGENSHPVESEAESKPQVQSLKELIDLITGRNLPSLPQEGDIGPAESLPFPFLALVGQVEMKLALLLALVNPMVGGVLLIGPRGSGKTTAARSLADLLPEIPRSLCYYGCLPEDVETGGMDAVCPDCAKKYAMGEPLAVMDHVRLIELPLNARLEDVIGGIDERAALHERVRLKRGILALADRNLLYVDEVNLLEDSVVDAILDAAAQGKHTVHRGPVTATYNSRFILIGSMNPEEGPLRPQIMDRFGLRVVTRGLSGKEALEDRFEAYQRVRAYLENPRSVVANYSVETALVRDEIQTARELLPKVRLPEKIARIGLGWTRQLKIDSLRAEITLFEAARACAAMDGRNVVHLDDLHAVAQMALRQRRSAFMVEYFTEHEDEDREIKTVMAQASN